MSLCFCFKLRSKGYPEDTQNNRSSINRTPYSYNTLNPNFSGKNGVSDPPVLPESALIMESNAPTISSLTLSRSLLRSNSIYSRISIPLLFDKHKKSKNFIKDEISVYSSELELPTISTRQNTQLISKEAIENYQDFELINLLYNPNSDNVAQDNSYSKSSLLTKSQSHKTSSKSCTKSPNDKNDKNKISSKIKINDITSEITTDREDGSFFDIFNSRKIKTYDNYTRLDTNENIENSRYAYPGFNTQENSFNTNSNYMRKNATDIKPSDIEYFTKNHGPDIKTNQNRPKIHETDSSDTKLSSDDISFLINGDSFDSNENNVEMEGNSKSNVSIISRKMISTSYITPQNFIKTKVERCLPKSVENDEDLADAKNNDLDSRCLSTFDSTKTKREDNSSNHVVDSEQLSAEQILNEDSDSSSQCQSDTYTNTTESLYNKTDEKSNQNKLENPTTKTMDTKNEVRSSSTSSHLSNSFKDVTNNDLTDLKKLKYYKKNSRSMSIQFIKKNYPVRRSLTATKLTANSKSKASRNSKYPRNLTIHTSIPLKSNRKSSIGANNSASYGSFGSPQHRRRKTPCIMNINKDSSFPKPNIRLNKTPIKQNKLNILNHILDPKRELIPNSSQQIYRQIDNRVAKRTLMLKTKRVSQNAGVDMIRPSFTGLNFVKNETPTTNMLLVENVRKSSRFAV
ncbi:hypothetical protein AYI70_g6670 [Smittium culicis]|uniref:Uncharacterized protein n=1 Tax=Smittium culicis TaxID=133412 RepID=A0A1R1XP40_9FUNG|nr:hypothetical protein AYI70_g6670 [Smittium culicis]